MTYAHDTNANTTATANTNTNANAHARSHTCARTRCAASRCCTGQSNMDYPLDASRLPGSGKNGDRVDCWDAANANCTLYNDTTPKACASRRGVGCGQCHYGCINNSLAEIDAMKQYNSMLRLNIIANSGAHFPTATRPVAEQANTGWLTPEVMGGGFSAGRSPPCLSPSLSHSLAHSQPSLPRTPPVP